MGNKKVNTDTVAPVPGLITTGIFNALKQEKKKNSRRADLGI